ncbi:hypothetical protein jhhlp_008706, partial [Lomentospora prolificans]
PKPHISSMSEGNNAPSQGSEEMGFRVLKSLAGSGAGARLGKLCLPNRLPVQTPAYIGVTSRGTLPHLTPDTIKKYTTFEAAYMALEDFIEKKDPPVYKTPSGRQRPLQAFTAFPKDRIIILGARRIPPVTTPLGNGNKHVQVFSSTGFRNVSVTEYSEKVAILRPDVAIPLVDLPHTSATPHSKKLIRMVDRTEEWVDTFIKERNADPATAEGVAVFAPIPPVERPIQWQYLEHLSDDLADSLSGLAIYDADIIPELSHYESLQKLPRLLLQPPPTPHHILRQIALGADMFLIPFINDNSDNGIALTFTFNPPQAPSDSGGYLPLGTNMWPVENASSSSPPMPGCKCYTCTNHSRAFIQHLLNANEMLSWTLLQIHNHHVMSEFFAAIRASLAEGEAAFEEARKRFSAAYEPELPKPTGQRPRARGYHFKSEPGEKINDPAWSNLNKVEGSAEKVEA